MNRSTRPERQSIAIFGRETKNSRAHQSARAVPYGVRSQNLTTVKIHSIAKSRTISPAKPARPRCSPDGYPRMGRQSCRRRRRYCRHAALRSSRKLGRPLQRVFPIWPCLTCYPARFMASPQSEQIWSLDSPSFSLILSWWTLRRPFPDGRPTAA
jgi:hypothetical protein